MRNGTWLALGMLAATLTVAPAAMGGDEPMTDSVQWPVEKTDLISYPGVWARHGSTGVILVADRQLEELAGDPDKVVDLSLGGGKRENSLRQICEEAQQRGVETFRIAFDHFWAQYVEGQAQPRKLYPDTDRYVELVGEISQFVKQYGMGMELSLLTPLEIGPGYHEATGESGMWMQYRKGLRNPQTGAYSVQLWRQTMWTNNKGNINLEDAGVRVFAFKEKPVRGTQYLAVNPKDIVEITDTVQVEELASLKQEGGEEATALGGYGAVRVRIFGSGRTDIGPLDRVVVVQQYNVPEMDYFSDTARPFLHQLIDKYADAGVHFNAIYSDETHIQGDWGYFTHHDNGEYCMRYVSPGLQAMYANRYGAEYADFAKYLVYFVRGQNDISNDVFAKAGTMHVFGETEEAIKQTALFRSRYYALLQDHLVELFLDAKEYLEERMGHRIHSQAHATWAESPTIDRWDTGVDNQYSHQYEYTSNFVWSNTVHQAASACHDYFKWGDFLHGTGNDTAECGWLDRNYTGFAIACSLGILNDIPNAYAAHWGMPRAIHHRRSALASAHGTRARFGHAMVQDGQHREAEVLMLYPLDLVASDERFGSWMSQYGYANYITQDKLTERGTVVDGQLDVAGYRFSTLVAVFEPFPTRALLDMMQQMLDQGGRVVWSGPAPLLARDGTPIRADWEALFGLSVETDAPDGHLVPGRQVDFHGALADVSPMIVLTDFLVDRAYPVQPNEGIEVLATLKDWTVGTLRSLPNGATATYLGFRPRDDQSKALGYETRYWFDILSDLGCYQPTGIFADANDNTVAVSRTGDYYVGRFPNGAISAAPHLRHVDECWPGGFHRDAEEDAKLLARIDLPSDEIVLDDLKVNGHTVTFRGRDALSFRVDDGANLVAFCGSDCNRITVDGRTTVFADEPLRSIAWAPVPDDRKVEGGAVMIIQAGGQGEVRISVAGLAGTVKLMREGRHGADAEEVPCTLEDGVLKFNATGGTLYVVPAA